MPSSLLALAPAIIELAYERSDELGRPIHVLDVGVGRGKYAMLLREYLGDRLATIHGIEAEQRYITPLLHALYNRVNRIAIEDCFGVYERAGKKLWAEYDLILCIDVLEHLDADNARYFLTHAEPPIIISTPRDFFENPEADEYPYESHRTHWSATDISALRTIDREDVNALKRYAAVLVRCKPLHE